MDQDLQRRSRIAPGQVSPTFPFLLDRKSVRDVRPARKVQRRVEIDECHPEPPGGFVVAGGREQLVDRSLPERSKLPPDEADAAEDQPRRPRPRPPPHQAHRTHFDSPETPPLPTRHGDAGQIGDFEQAMAEAATDLPARSETLDLDRHCRILDRRTTHPCCNSPGLPEPGDSDATVGEDPIQDIRTVADFGIGDAIRPHFARRPNHGSETGKRHVSAVRAHAGTSVRRRFRAATCPVQ